MRALLVLLPLAILSGCITSDLVPASTEDPPLASTPPSTAPPPASSTPPPTSTTPPPSSTPPPPSEPTPTTPPPETPEPPPPRPPHHAEQAGWIRPEPPALGMTLRLPVPVLTGASNLTILVEVATTTAAPRAPANVTIELFAPDGSLVAQAGRTAADESPAAAIELAAPLAPGEHVAVVTLVGASDGQSVGDSYRALVHVAYGAGA